MNLGGRFLMGMLSGAGSVVIKTGLNIAVIPVLIAHLGLEMFGLYILLLAILEIAMLLDFGAITALVKLLGDATASLEERRACLKVGHVLFGLIAGLFLLGSLLDEPFIQAFRIATALQPVARLAFTLTMVEAAISIYSCYFHAVLLAHCAHQWKNIGDTLYYLVANLGALVLLLMGADLVAVLAIRLVGSAVRLLLMMRQSVRFEPDALLPRAPFQMAIIRQVTHLSAHAMMLNFCVIISHKIDDFVIARFLPLSAVGIYEIVFRLLGITITVCLKLSEGTFPLFSRFASENRTQDARQLFLRMSNFINLVAVMIVVLILSFYPELFGLFSADRIPIQDTLPVLWIAVPCVLSGVLQMEAGTWLFSWGHQKYLTTTSLIAALANLALSLILVQTMGLAGVALGTLIPQLIQHQVGLIGKTCRELNISLRDYLLAVHGPVIVPALMVLLWAQLWTPTVAASAWPLLSISLIAGSGMLLGFALWFRLTATALEREILIDRFLKPLSLKLQNKPALENLPHA